MFDQNYQLAPIADVNLKNFKNLETRPITKYHEFRARLDLAIKSRHNATRIIVLKQYRIFLNLQNKFKIIFLIKCSRNLLDFISDLEPVFTKHLKATWNGTVLYLIS